MFASKNKTKVLEVTENYLALVKAYDLKMKSKNPNEKTLQTLLLRKYPHLINNALFHEFYFVQRLDYPTSGVMCIPLTLPYCREISRASQKKQIEKYYIGIVRGWFSSEYLDVAGLLGEDERDDGSMKRMTTDVRYQLNPRSARTMILVLERGFFDNYPATKILARTVTGRRHQVRVHLSNLGHTVVGDYTYSNSKDVAKRMYLHSIRLFIPTRMGVFEIETADPFKDTKNWKTMQVVNEFDEDVYDKLRIY